MICAKHRINIFEKVSIRLYILLCGILISMSFSMVDVIIEPLMPTMLIIVGRTVHPSWLRTVVHVSYFSSFLVAAS